VTTAGDVGPKPGEGRETGTAEGLEQPAIGEAVAAHEVDRVGETVVETAVERVDAIPLGR